MEYAQGRENLKHATLDSFTKLTNVQGIPRKHDSQSAD